MIKGYNCRTHNMACVYEGIVHHVKEMESKFGVGLAGCDIVETWRPETRKGSEKTRERGIIPRVAVQLVKAGALSKELEVLDKRAAREVFAEKDADRRSGHIGKELIQPSSIGHPQFWIREECTGVLFDDPSWVLANKIQRVENMCDGWVKAMIGNNHIPSRAQIAAYKDKMMHKMGCQVLYGIGPVDMYNMDIPVRRTEVVGLPVVYDQQFVERITV